MRNNMVTDAATPTSADSRSGDRVPIRSANHKVKREIFRMNSLLRLQRDLAAVKSRAPKARPAPSMALLQVPQAARPYSFVSVDYPGAATTEVLDSNGSTDVGIFIVDPATPVTQSFTHSGNEYQILNVPGSTGSLLVAINSLGVMAGAYNDMSNNLHGFVDNAGTIITVDFPGSTETAVFAINDAGDLAGIWVDAVTHTHGFIDKGGVFTPIDHPSATLTEVTGINTSGDVIGIWEDASSVSHGFIWNNGVFTDIDFPGAKSTVTFGINDSGEVAGYYEDASSVLHGFLYQNSFSIVDVAGATGTLLTRVSNNGNLAGVFVDALKENHGLTAH
jgi:probable HAF family extracellular repeat protein